MILTTIFCIPITEAKKLKIISSSVISGMSSVGIVFHPIPLQHYLIITLIPIGDHIMYGP